MKSRNALLSAMFIGIGVVAGYAPVASAAPKPAGVTPAVIVVDDKTIEARIETAMKKDATLKNQDVDVDVEKGIVTLTGKVRSESRKARAGRHANIAGVVSVNNQLTIDANAGKSVTAKVTAATKEAGHDIAHGAKVVGDKAEDAASATAGTLASGAVTTKISSRFVDEILLKGSDINVDTANHVVTLRGRVTSMAGSERAEAIARGTDGVTRVVNELVVVPAEK